MVLEQLDVYIQKYLDSDHTHFIKINSMLIIDQNVKFKSVRLLEDSIRENLGGIWFGNEF